MNEIFDNLLTVQNTQRKVAEQARDNLFNADERTKMIAAYGYSEAMRITIEDLI